MAYFPLFIDLENRPCLVIGGGPVALRKARVLCSYGAQVTMVAPEFAAEPEETPGIVRRQRVFRDADIEGMALCAAASDQREVNHRAAELCRSAGIPVNTADSREDSTFLFPSVIKKGRLSVGISTGGAAPSEAKRLRKVIEEALPDDIEETLAEAERERTLNKGDYDPWRNKPAAVGRVSLCGAGCGGKGWLTLRAAEILRSCDAVVYDALIDPAVLLLAPAAAERHPVGKRSGRHSASQEEINRLLIRLAREGKQTVRLKGGDPYIFGRGGEEAEALTKAGIPWEEVPGITSAAAIPAQAGIPLTHRRISRSFTVVTGHTASEAGLPEDPEVLAGLRGTLVFLMALSSLREIADELIRAGKSPDTPAAVISGGNSEYPCDVRGPLCQIAALADAADVKAPAVIVVGAAAEKKLKPLE